MPLARHGSWVSGVIHAKLGDGEPATAKAQKKGGTASKCERSRLFGLYSGNIMAILGRFSNFLCVIIFQSHSTVGSLTIAFGCSA